MVKVNCLNKISKAGMKLFSDKYEIVDDFAQADAALVRSAAMHDMELPEGLLAIARAGAGTNNIPLDKCAAWLSLTRRELMQMVLRSLYLPDSSWLRVTSQAE